MTVNMESPSSFTYFPNLHDTINPEKKNAILSTAWPSNLPKNLLIMSWAVLLHSYTGVADPVFSLSENSIQVDLQNVSWSHVGVRDGYEHNGRHTCLALTKVSRLEWELARSAI
jgi:hypothetical protein